MVRCSQKKENTHTRQELHEASEKSSWKCRNIADISGPEACYLGAGHTGLTPHTLSLLYNLCLQLLRVWLTKQNQ